MTIEKKTHEVETDHSFTLYCKRESNVEPGDPSQSAHVPEFCVSNSTLN
jgi:hypothetical protein